MNSVEQESMFELNDQDFFEYLSLNAQRSNNSLPPDGLDKITTIASKEQRAYKLEELYQKVVRNESTVDEYNKLYEQLVTEFQNKVNGTKPAKPEPAIEAPKAEQQPAPVAPAPVAAPAPTGPAPVPAPAPEVPKPEPKKELSDSSKKLIEYFNLEIKRVNTPLDDKEKEKLESIRKEVQRVRTLEEAHRRVDALEIPTQVLKTLREKYKKEIVDEIKVLGLNEKDIMPDDSAIYKQLDEISKKRKTEAPKEVSKTSLADIKPVINIKEEQNKKEEIATESKGLVRESLHDAIAKDEHEKNETEPVDENKMLKEEIEMLKAKIDFLRDEINTIKANKYAAPVGKSKLPKEFVELARYFQLDAKRTKSEINDEELAELRELTRGDNTMIDEIEDIVRMKANDELTIKEYNEKHGEVYNKFKAMLQEKYNEAK